MGIGGGPTRIKGGDYVWPQQSERRQTEEADSDKTQCRDGPCPQLEECPCRTNAAEHYDLTARRGQGKGGPCAENIKPV